MVHGEPVANSAPDDELEDDVDAAAEDDDVLDDDVLDAVDAALEDVTLELDALLVADEVAAADEDVAEEVAEDVAAALVDAVADDVAPLVLDVALADDELALALDDVADDEAAAEEDEEDAAEPPVVVTVHAEREMQMAVRAGVHRCRFMVTSIQGDSMVLFATVLFAKEIFTDATRPHGMRRFRHAQRRSPSGSA